MGPPPRCRGGGAPGPAGRTGCVRHGRARRDSVPAKACNTDVTQKSRIRAKPSDLRFCLDFLVNSRARHFRAGNPAGVGLPGRPVVAGHRDNGTVSRMPDIRKGPPGGPRRVAGQMAGSVAGWVRLRRGRHTRAGSARLGT
ncbi:hypothetical protein SCOCK_840013 [Actinacidiphila cocklensis]|uniref:Uncharacterized protein n=1 Tax=Actinacidiphila cocklensis TaxID=887465 RepID=A0A9W4GW20_9ACTN|nr:hypothetical protein SCOCK_840013 [Actinacidiphila cocklensis]